MSKITAARNHPANLVGQALASGVPQLVRTGQGRFELRVGPQSSASGGGEL